MWLHGEEYAVFANIFFPPGVFASVWSLSKGFPCFFSKSRVFGVRWRRVRGDGRVGCFAAVAGSVTGTTTSWTMKIPNFE